MTWVDQGLWFTLILNGIALLILIPLACCCAASRRLSTARIYRPNQTVEPSEIRKRKNKRSNNNNHIINNNENEDYSPRDNDNQYGGYTVPDGVTNSRRLAEYKEANQGDGEGNNNNNGHGVYIAPFDGGYDAEGVLLRNKRSTLRTMCNIKRLWRAGEYNWEDSDRPIMHDPMIEIVLFILKLCFLIFFVVAWLSAAWIFVCCLTDDYIHTFTVENDPNECRNATFNDCDNDKSYFCKWNYTALPTPGPNSTGACYPITHNGLYDLSVQNLTPHSTRLWAVGALVEFFGFFAGILLFFSLRTMTAFAQRVLQQQTSTAIGYRTVLVKGLNNRSLPGGCTDSSENFLKAFLSLDTYFSTVDSTFTFNGTFGICDKKTVGPDELHLFRDRHGYISTKVVDIIIPRRAPKKIYEKLEEYRSIKQSLQDAVGEQDKHWARLDAEREVAYADHRLKGISYTVDNTHPPLMGTAFPKCCCCKVPLVEHYSNKLRDASEELNKAIAEVPHQEQGGYAFVIFKDAACAFEFVELFNKTFGGCCSSSEARIAGPYEGLERCNLEKSKVVSWILFFLVTIIFILLVFFWAVPVGFLGSLSSLAGIPGIGPAFQSFINVLPTALVGILTAYLPLIVLIIFNIVLPMIIRWFVRLGGSMTKAETDNSVMFQYYIFLVMTGVVIQAALQGGLFQLAGIISNPTGDAIIAFIIAIVSPQGGYWYATVIGAGCLSMWLGALLIGPYILSVLFAKGSATQRKYNGLFVHQDYNFAMQLAVHSVYISIGMFFHCTVPLLSVFVGIYFFNAYWVTRALLYDTYRNKVAPINLMTSFGLAVTTLRVLGFTYLVGVTGITITVALKKHYGGMILCLWACVMALLSFIYIIWSTMQWKPNTVVVREWQRLAARKEQDVKEAAESPNKLLEDDNNNNNFINKNKSNDNKHMPIDYDVTFAEKQEALENRHSADANDKIGLDGNIRPYHSLHSQLHPVNPEADIEDALQRDYAVCYVWHEQVEKNEMRQKYNKQCIQRGNKLSEKMIEEREDRALDEATQSA